MKLHYMRSEHWHTIPKLRRGYPSAGVPCEHAVGCAVDEGWVAGGLS